MKRINPDTKKPFKRGDKRPPTYKQDGRLFHSYMKKRVNSDGFYGENWYKPKALKSEKEKQTSSEANRRKAFREKPNPKRINPKTNNPYKRGDKEKGKIFWGYTCTNLDNGYEGETWVKKDDWLRRTLSTHTMGNVRKRAKKYGLPVDIDTEYLLSIYPNPPICPILGIKLELGVDNKGSTKNSPSLDRIIPQKGYVKGNVIFISGYANIIKQDATPEEVMKVAKWLNKKRKT